MAPASRAGMVARSWRRSIILDRIVGPWLGLASRLDLSDRPFRTFRAATGVRALARAPLRAANLQDAKALQDCAPSDLSRLPAGILGGAPHDPGTSALRRRYDGLHLHRHLLRGKGPHRALRRGIPAISPTGADDRADPAQSRRGFDCAPIASQHWLTFAMPRVPGSSRSAGDLLAWTQTAAPFPIQPRLAAT